MVFAGKASCFARQKQVWRQKRCCKAAIASFFIGLRGRIHVDARPKLLYKPAHG
ncbi:hypothetical protein M798_07970 [Brucella melitensis ADMAS-G1]|nr:hypothetical protein M798_07970 [Brucella melitensis ADMAS-G1]